MRPVIINILISCSLISCAEQQLRRYTVITTVTYPKTYTVTLPVTARVAKPYAFKHLKRAVKPVKQQLSAVACRDMLNAGKL